MNLKFFFPLNYDYSSKLLGIIEYKLLTPLAIYGILLFFILKNIDLDFFIKIGIFFLFFLPVLLMLNSRVNSEPFYSFLFAIIKHFFKRKTYLYKRVIWCGINPKLQRLALIATFLWKISLARKYK